MRHRLVASSFSQRRPPPRGQIQRRRQRAASSSSTRSEKLVAGPESASPLTLHEPHVSSSEVMLNTTSSEEVVISRYNFTDVSPPRAPSLESKIYIRRPPNWPQSLYEAEGAITRHVSELQRPAMCEEQGKTSFVDRLVHQCMHYADGTPKRGPNSRKRKNTESEQHYLVQASVEQYNEDHNLFGVLAHELARHEWIFERDRWFYHFNFITKAKEANGTISSSNLFFAEVSHMQGEDAWEVNCCCMINSKDDGQGHCYGCRNNGSPDMQHSNDTGVYTQVVTWTNICHSVVMS